MLNFDRNSVEIPEIKKNHKTPFIYKQLGLMQRNKCYLCEETKNAPENFHIEHFIPHKEDEKLKFDWNNLFLTCVDCNLYKGTQTNILNPCNNEHDVEHDIIYKLTMIDHLPRFYASDENNPLIVNTCKLLDKIHNGDNNKSKNKTSSLRNAIDRRVKELLIVMLNFNYAITQNLVVEKQKAEREIKDIVSRNAPYTMLMRSLAIKYEFQYLFD